MDFEKVGGTDLAVNMGNQEQIYVFASGSPFIMRRIFFFECGFVVKCLISGKERGLNMLGLCGNLEEK